MVVLVVFRGEVETTPEDLARRWVSENVDAVGEDIAGWMSGENPFLRELGGEYIEDRIHDVIGWEYSAAERRSNGLYDFYRAWNNRTTPSSVWTTSRSPYIS